jgi:hypothetical protein
VEREIGTRSAMNVSSNNVEEIDGFRVVRSIIGFN